MKIPRILIPAALPMAIGLLSLSSCNDEMSPIGGSIFDQEVSVYVDSSAYKLKAFTQQAEVIDARSTNNLLGNVNVPEYGSLNASFVSRLLSASKMEIPDSITVEKIDSIRMILEVPRATVVGDSTAPQQLTVYRLTKQLPDNITSDFDPEGYYDPTSSLGSRNYTLSGLALSDSAFRALKSLPISVTLPKEMAIDAFNAYRRNPDIFEWPQEFTKKFPGIFVKSTFGRGAIAAVKASKIFTYWHHTVTRTVVKDDQSVKVPVLIKDSVCLFSTAPEVLASNNLSYKPSASILKMVEDGEKIITTPLGYNVRVFFPGKQLLDEYHESARELSVINNVAFSIPATEIKNDHGITTAPYMLMIRTSEIKDFFANAKVPDNKTSFYSAYSSANGRYYFSQMRQYLVDLNNVYGKVSDKEFEDLCDFTLIPVNITTEVVSNNDNTTTTYVTGCTPYLARPTMTHLDTDNALVVFTFTHQYID